MTDLSHRAISSGGRTTPSPFWQQHDEDLRRAVSAGLTATEAARLLGVSKSAVISRAQRIDIIWARAPEVPVKEVKPPLFPPPGRCLFIHGDPRRGAEFCGEEVVEYGHPYCAEHHMRCYQRQLSK